MPNNLNQTASITFDTQGHVVENARFLQLTDQQRVQARK
jgi:hypothetical protein